MATKAQKEVDIALDALWKAIEKYGDNSMQTRLAQKAYDDALFKLLK